MNAPTSTLGRAIRQRRIEIGLTQEELAERIGPGIRQSDISRLERDRIQLPRAQRLRALASALEMEPGELLSLSGWDGSAVPHPVTAFDPEPEDEAWESIPVQDVTREQESYRLTEVLRQSKVVQAKHTEVIARSDRTAASWRRRFGITSEADTE